MTWFSHIYNTKLKNEMMIELANHDLGTGCTTSLNTYEFGAIWIQMGMTSFYILK